MILGTGEMAERALAHPKDEGFRTVLAANRRSDRTVEPAGQVERRAISAEHAGEAMVAARTGHEAAAAPSAL